MTNETTLELTSLHITDQHQIEQLLDFIHDENFDLNEIQYRPEEHTVEIPFRRVFHRGPRKRIRNWFFYTIYEVDVIRSSLLINKVEEYKVHDRERIGIYSFDTVKYDQGHQLLIFYGEPNLEITLRVTELKIVFQDVAVKGKASLSYTFGLIEGGPSKVYD
jgi:hypothetical protein